MPKNKSDDGLKNNFLKDRIISTDKVPALQLLANPFNFRIHTSVQRKLVTSSLDDIGWVRHVLVNHRNGHVVDGHLRLSQALSKDEEAIIPVDYVDLNDDEEVYLLSLLDFTTGLAVIDTSRREKLLQSIASNRSVLETVTNFVIAVDSQRSNLYGALADKEEKESLSNVVLNENLKKGDSQEQPPQSEDRLYETVFVLNKEQTAEFNFLMKDIIKQTGLNISLSVFLVIKEWYVAQKRKTKKS